MNIGLVNIEPKIFNTAYMQMSWYYKNIGNTVGWWSPKTDGQFDHVYCSSLFGFTDKSKVPERAICGGTGYDVTSRLSVAIEGSQLDYSIYPDCKTSYIWFSRGCNRNCSWCVVPQKEGKFHLVNRKQLNPNGSYITIMDNDFFANPNWCNTLLWLDRMPVDIMGINVRTITELQCAWLNKVRRWKNKQFKIAWDNPKEQKSILVGITRMTKFIKPYKIMCYVLIGYLSTPAEDLHRVESLRTWDIDPFVMPYDKNDDYQKKFTRWVNHKAIFKTVKWKDYKQSKIRNK